MHEIKILHATCGATLPPIPEAPSVRQAYVAGSYTASTRTATLQNISRALAAAYALTRAGWFAIVPHTSGSHHAAWDDAMDNCCRTIRSMNPRRDALVLLPGWEDSRGALMERELATDMGLPVLTLDEALVRRCPAVMPEAV